VVFVEAMSNPRKNDARMNLIESMIAILTELNAEENINFTFNKFGLLLNFDVVYC